MITCILSVKPNQYKDLIPLYSSIIDDLHNKFSELNVSVISFKIQLPNILLLVKIPDQLTLKYLTSLPIIEKFAKPKYIDKKTEESGNITYIYSEKHVKERNRKKVKRIIQLGKSLKKLRSQIKSDLKDDSIKSVALAVSLIDETYERVGNPDSAKHNHFGVTTWRKKHVSFSKGKAIIKYKGKAGVNQIKTITNKSLISSLKNLTKNKKPNEELFPFVSADDVNKYLKPFKITAKDIRGFHANHEMKKALKLAKSDKEGIKNRKEKFKKALEETAKLVGHNPSTLKNQYLAPSIEKNYLETGKFTIKAFILSKRSIKTS